MPKIKIKQKLFFKDKHLVLDSNANTFFADNYQRTIKAIKEHLGFDI